MKRTYQSIGFPPEIVGAGRIALVASVVLSLTTLVGLTQFPIAHLIDDLGSPLPQEYVDICLGYVLLFFVASPYERREKLMVVLAGLIPALIYTAQNDYGAVAGSERDLWFIRTVVVGGWTGVAPLVFLIWQLKNPDAVRRSRSVRLLAASGLIVLSGIYSGIALDLSAAIWPIGLDGVAYHIDQAFGGQPSAALALLVEPYPWLHLVLWAVYFVLPFGFAVVYALGYREGDAPRVLTLRFFVISAMVAYVCYCISRVSGPYFAFGPHWADHPPAPAEVPTGEMLLDLAKRNGIPSMHFGWALSFWLTSLQLRSRPFRVVSLVYLLLTALATLERGEHYLCDLIIAVPVVLALHAACLNVSSAPFDDARRQLMRWGFGLLIAWLAAINLAGDWLARWPVLVWIASTVTLVVPVVLYRRVFELARHLPAREQVPVSLNLALPGRTTLLRGLFAASSAVTAVYFTIAVRALGGGFETDQSAGAIAACVLLASLAAGAWLGGRIVQRGRTALGTYAYGELLMLVCCAITVFVVPWIGARATGVLHDDVSTTGLLNALRWTASAVGLMPPALLVGIKLPLQLRRGVACRASVEETAAVLGAALIAAALGALLATYLIIPALGVNRSVLLVAVGYLAIALGVLELRKRLDADRGGDAPLDAPSEPLARTATDVRLAWATLVTGGAMAVILVMNQMRLVAVVVGSSVYVGSLMTATCLGGLGCGVLIARPVSRALRPQQALLLSALGLALSLLAGLLLWDSMPGYFAAFSDYPSARDFGSREAIRAVVCTLLLLPPSLFLGLGASSALGIVMASVPFAALAAFGRALGVTLLAGLIGLFFGLGLWVASAGTLHSIQVVCGVAALLALGATLAQGRSAWGTPTLGAWVLLVVLGFAQRSQFDLDRLASGANIHFESPARGSVLDSSDGPDGGFGTVVSLATQASVHDPRQLRVDGAPRGDDALNGDYPAQLGTVMLPLLHTSARDAALVIDYGTGVASKALQDAGFRSLDIVTPSRALVALSNREFNSGGAAEAPGSQLAIADEARFLDWRDRRYDLISAMPGPVWSSGVATLYDRQFYRRASNHLSAHGVLAELLPLSHVTPREVLAILVTVHSEFSDVWLYTLGGHGIIVASNDESARPNGLTVALLDSATALATERSQLGGSFAVFLKTAFLNSSGIEAALQASRLSPVELLLTDDNRGLEFSTPKDNSLDGERSLQWVLSSFAPFRIAPPP